jgi:ABC-type transporter Mla MlaB component
VAFSFFKKDSKDATAAVKAGSRASAKTAARPLAGPVNRNPASTVARGAQVPTTTTNTMPDKDLHRTLALETAAKIDAIESEMARDFLRPGGAPTMFPNSAANSTLQRPSQQPDAVQAAPANGKDDKSFEALDIISEDWAGNVNAFEVSAEGGGSAIEETAILFANGLIEPAEAGLRAAIQSDQLGESAQHGWLMLFELLQQRGDKAGFDSLTIEYVLRFESSPPAWLDYKDDDSDLAAVALAVGRSAQPASAPIIVLPETVDEGVVKHLEQLKNHSQSHQSISLDSSNVRSIDPVGAELLLRVINAFKRASHELLLQGADQLLTPLRAAVEAGRRDPSDAVWMLLLEVFRLLNRQHDFEETGIQYCITYEVSPPSWEPAPPNLKTRAAVPQVVAPEAVDGLSWRGTLRGEGEPHFGRLMTASRVDKRLVVDCMYLKRVEFATATGMLAMVTKVRQNGASIEFRNVNYLIGALFSLLGVDAVAQIQLRRV